MKAIYKSPLNIIDLPPLSSLTIQNLDRHATVSLSFQKKYAPDFRTNNHLLASIIKEQDSDEARCLAIWSMLCRYTYNAPPFSEHSHRLHDPVQLLSQSGYGFCDDINAALLNLAECLGIRTRMWQLDGHVVSEVFYKHSWHLLDASFQFYCRAASGEIASLEQIFKNQALVKQVFSSTSIAKLITLFRQLSIKPTLTSIENQTYQHLKTSLIEFVTKQNILPSATDLLLVDQVLSSQYKRFLNIYKANKDADCSTWWNSHASSHSTEVSLGPKERVSFYLEKLPKTHIAAYLKPGLNGIGKAVLEKEISLDQVQNISCSFPIWKIEITKKLSIANRLYISTNKKDWELIEQDKVASNTISYNWSASKMIMEFMLKTEEVRSSNVKYKIRIFLSISALIFPLSLDKTSPFSLRINSKHQSLTGVELLGKTL